MAAVIWLLLRWTLHTPYYMPHASLVPTISVLDCSASFPPESLMN